jgi:hypothetical protein
MRMTPTYRSVASFSHIAKLKVSLWWHTAASGVDGSLLVGAGLLSGAVTVLEGVNSTIAPNEAAASDHTFVAP